MIRSGDREKGLRIGCHDRRVRSVISVTGYGEGTRECRDIANILTVVAVFDVTPVKV